MSKRLLSDKVTELHLLVREEENLAKNFIDEKTQQALEAHEQQLESCREMLAALETCLRQIREIQQYNEPVQLLEVVLYGLFLYISDPYSHW